MNCILDNTCPGCKENIQSKIIDICQIDLSLPSHHNQASTLKESPFTINDALAIQKLHPNLRYFARKSCVNRHCSNRLSYYCLWSKLKKNKCPPVSKRQLVDKTFYLRTCFRKKAHDCRVSTVGDSGFCMDGNFSCGSLRKKAPDCNDTTVGDSGFSMDEDSSHCMIDKNKTCPNNCSVEDDPETANILEPHEETNEIVHHLTEEFLKMKRHSSADKNTSFHLDYVTATRNVLGRSSLQKQFCEDKVSDIKLESFELYLKIGELVLTLDKNGRELLSRVLSLALTEHDKCTAANDATKRSHLYYPRTEKEFMSHYLNPNNQSALVNNIPIPFVECLDGGTHSYSNFIHAIKHICVTTPQSIHTEIPIKDKYASLVYSDKFKNFFEKCLPQMRHNENNVIVMIFVWSDGFDPNRCKLNRGSAWAMTGTYVFYDCVKRKIFLVKTELLSCGMDKADHDPVFRRMVEDLRESCSSEDGRTVEPFKAPSLYLRDSSVNYFPVLMGASMDNPERRWNFGLKNGNSKNHGYFGLSCFFDELQKPFSPCKNCCKRIEEYVSLENWNQPCFNTTYHCSQCHGLCTEGLTRDGCYKKPMFDPPKVDGVDNTKIPGIGLAERPGFLTGEILKEAWEFAKDMYVGSRWSTTEVKLYLNLFCLNEYQVTRFLKEAKEVATYNIFKEGGINELTTSEKEEMERKVNEDQDWPIKLCRPLAIWDLISLDEAYECIMHQAMNSSSAMSSFVFEWTISNSKTPTLIKECSEKLNDVKKMRSSSFKAIPFYRESMGGYVGENHVTLNAIAPWLFKCLTDKSMAPPTIQPPPEGLALGRMTVPQLRAWLQIRNIEFHPNLKKKDLLTLSRTYNADPNQALRTWNRGQLTAWLVSRGQITGTEEETRTLVRRVSSLQKENAPIRQIESQSNAACGVALRRMYSAFNRYHSSLIAGDLHRQQAKNRSLGMGMLFLTQALSYLKIKHPKVSAQKTLFKKCTMYGILRCTGHFSKIYSLKAIHEGGENGEAYVKKMRKYLTHGLKGNWHGHLQRKMHRGNGLEYMNWCIHKQNRNSQKIYDRSYRPYTGFTQLQNEIILGTCMSLVIYTHGGTFSIGFVVKESRKRWIFQIAKPLYVYTEDYGFSYFRVDIQSQAEATKTILDKSSLTIEIGSTGIRREYHTAAIALARKRSEDNQPLFAIVLPDGRSLKPTSSGLGFCV